MVPSQHKYLKTSRPEYAKAAVKQDNALKNTLIKMTMVLKKGNKKYYKEIEKSQAWVYMPLFSALLRQRQV